MRSWCWFIVAASLALVSPRARAEQAAQPPAALESHLGLEHVYRDMLDVQNERYDVTVRLGLDRSGEATLELRGALDLSWFTIPVPSDPAPSTPPRAPRRVELADRWIGTWRLVADAIEVRFTRSEAVTPAIEVDVVWRCLPQELEVAGARVRAWQCRSAQRTTRPSGAAYPLAPYLQIPLYLAAAAARLDVRASARSGADRHAELESADFARLP
jgi:hypothetical protein